VFEAASKPNNPIINAAAKLEFQNRLMNYESISGPAPFTVYEVEKCTGMLKHGKAPGIDGLSTEHIVYCHPIIIVQLTCLFNSMLKLGYVLDEFGTGVIIPLMKNATGDVSSTDN